MLRKGITTFYVNYQVVPAIRTSFVVPKVSNRNWFLNPRTTPSVRFTAKGCQNPEPPNWFKIPNHPTGSKSRTTQLVLEFRQVSVPIGTIPSVRLAAWPNEPILVRIGTKNFYSVGKYYQEPPRHIGKIVVYLL